MFHTLAIRREDLSKKGERRVAIVPNLAQQLTLAGHRLLIQPAIHPDTGESKRIFTDRAYKEIGAEISEDLTEAKVIFGLKEIDPAYLSAEKTYFYFSHTHKGQLKNRKMLSELVSKKCSLIDYELICNDKNQRLITAFTYFAGYAGMIDSLWMIGERMEIAGYQNAFSNIPQSIEKQDLDLIKEIIKKTGEQIKKEGTPSNLPPIITCFMGNGKTSQGAQSIYDLLPVEEITLSDLPHIYNSGNRKQVYKLVLEIPEMFRLKEGAGFDATLYGQMTDQAKTMLYLREPQHFESNIDQVFPYISLAMNCIIWSEKYPRLLTRKQAHEWYQQHKTLWAIGDISCDPEGAIQFSQDTWIDRPVFIYNPDTDESLLGFEGEGLAVLAVNNLPCEFSADASTQFSQNLKPFLAPIAQADYEALSPEEAGLPEEICQACIMWRGEFRPTFAYMQDFLVEA